MTYPNDPANSGSFTPQPDQPFSSQPTVPPVPTPPLAPLRYRSRETKPSFLTTELYAYLAAVIAIVATSFYYSEDNGQPDEFTADQALRYITWLTIGYMVARGLAKAGRPQFSDREAP